MPLLVSILSAHSQLGHSLFANGFSGRGVAELIAAAGYRRLNLSALSFAHGVEGQP